MSVKKTILDMKRVWKVTKKPTKEEYQQTLKIVIIGFLFVGIVGFVMELLWQLLLRHFFSM